MNTDSTYDETSRTVPAIHRQGERSLNANRARALALDCGFTEAGLVSIPYAAGERDASRFESWIHAGHAGAMQYLQRTTGDAQLVRSRPAIPFPWARSAVVCLANYNTEQPRSIDPSPPAAAWIARYAWSSRTDANGERRPSDYHKVLLKRLRTLEARLLVEFGAFESRAYVDTGPVVERSLAVAAGLGWTGKNTCLIHPKFGSYGFLAVLLTDLPLENASAPAMVPDRCGSCRRCLDACPTQALIAPYQMDATRCISYLTIEYKGPLSEELMAGMGRQVFGCDICQDVCPWNSPRRAPISADSDLAARPELVNPAIDWLAALDEAAFERHFNGSPVRRAGFSGLRRNLAVAMGNSGLDRFAATLRNWAKHADGSLSAAARRALDKLQAQGDKP
ncbi:MAG: tRNA epoxyqueuosine(34) reductase QueG [Terracidiphilus sp.]